MLRKGLFLKDIINYIPSKVIPIILGIMTVSILTRVLTTEEYGLYSLIITTVSIIGSILFGWINNSYLRFYETYRENNKEGLFVSTGFWGILYLFLFIVFLFYIIQNKLFRFLNIDFIKLLEVGIWLVGVQELYKWVLTILRASRKSVKFSLYSSLYSLFFLVLSVLFLKYSSLRVIGILYAIIISNLIFVFIEMVLFLREGFLSFSFSQKIFNKVFNYGFPLVGVSIAGLILSVADRYMIQYYMGADAVGLYSAGYRVAEMGIKNIFTVLMLAAFPLIIKEYVSNGEESAAKLINKFMDYYFLILTPVVFGIWSLSYEIVSILLGKEFLGSYTLLPWIAFGIYALGLTQYINKPFELKEKTRSVFYIILFSCLVNIILNVFLIPNYGIIGAAYSTLISYVLYLIISIILSQKFFPLFLEWNSFIKAILASIIMFLLIEFFDKLFLLTGIIDLVIKILMGMLFYLLALYIFREKRLIELMN